MGSTLQKKIVGTLLSSGKLSKEKYDSFIKKFQPKDDDILQKIVEAGVVSERDILVVISREVGIPPIDLSKVKFEEDVMRMIPEKLAKKYDLIVVSRVGENMTVAVNDPTDIVALDDVRSVTHCQISLVLATLSDIHAAMKNYARKAEEAAPSIDETALTDDTGVEVVAKGEETGTFDMSIEGGDSAPVTKVVTVLISEAIKRRASDLHIEPQEKNLRVRYRIDGELHTAFELPKKNQNAVLARLKIMSNLDITENRVPQDGRFRIKLEGKEIDFRVSSLPTIFGNKIVMRALDKQNLSVGLETLGFLPDAMSDFKKALAHPYGIILVTGPTGSGKSTTLYSVLNEMNVPTRNIVTVEDPVEYQVGGITQMPVQSDIGLDFASGLRSILRQSPDVIMIGEIRDFETADIAIKASLTGHMVLSTLHTNDSVGAITRLANMGVEPFLIASSLIMACAQRLVRRICPHCKSEANIPDEVIKELSAKYPAVGGVGKFYAGKGCAKCNNTGYHGRIAILETLLLDDTIREMINKEKSEEEIKRYLKTRNFRNLRENAIINFCKGVTTLEEVFRVT
ncbi:MAG TPA: ATPase, T2SS/T4P/T4SS family [Candidatus Omnitrophota bacterium]|nr:ATPase, T2SS/T4P/T4SS family [Candidatus Omnitrophota bacterium]HPS19996.1 ATPase, T2SS/T4P/T4SS family [Candidatus Omnitrophota bacterium]